MSGSRFSTENKGYTNNQVCIYKKKKKKKIYFDVLNV